MTVAILFDANIDNGGSYQMSINNLLEFKKNFEKENINFVILTHENYKILDELHIEYQIIKMTIFDYIFIFLRNIPFVNKFFDTSLFISIFEKKLLRKKISLMVFLFTSYKAFLLKKIKFISTVLDVCHREFPNIKEVSGKVFFAREYLNKNILPLSYLIISESAMLKRKIFEFYKIKQNKIISIPNTPSNLITKNTDVSLEKIKSKYNIYSKFYFYPAQFWSHKNHIIILEAIKKLKDNKVNINFVFCGRDKGNLNFIKKKILDFKIKDNIKILDYVENEDVYGLYKLCEALVMPTYFGPTNIPPVEAWSLGTPVIYSSYLSNHGKNAALYFDPNSSDELIEAITKLQVSNIKQNLILNGRNRFINIMKENIKGHSSLIKKIKLIYNNY